MESMTMHFMPRMRSYHRGDEQRNKTTLHSTTTTCPWKWNRATLRQVKRSLTIQVQVQVVLESKT